LARNTTQELPGSEAELEVWESLKNAFDSSDTGVAYYKYPIVDKSGGQFDREPDFVVSIRNSVLLSLSVRASASTTSTV